MKLELRSRAIEAARGRALPWDDLRDRRAQRSTWERYVRETLTLPAPERDSLRPSVRVIFVAALAVATAVAAVFVLRLRRAPAVPAPASSASALPVAEELRRVAFDAGSQGFLEPGAELETNFIGPARFEVTQRKGKVRYDIRHDPQREFVVHVADVTLAVLGTEFSVELRESMVNVRVERGRVRVFDAERSTDLKSGEALEMRGFFELDPLQNEASDGVPQPELVEPDPAQPSDRELAPKSDEPPRTALSPPPPANPH